MFGRNNKNGSAKGFEINPNTLNLIGSGTEINGTLNTAGDIRIDGIVNGTVTAKSKIVLGESARVDGDILCQNADLSGWVNGNIFVDELLTLKSTARIQGDIRCARLVIEAGAAFNGCCQMGENGTEGKGKQEAVRERQLQEA